MNDETDEGQRPVSRRDALRTAGLAGAVTSNNEWRGVGADSCGDSYHPEPLWRRAGRRDHVTAVLPADALCRQQQHLLPGSGADRPRRNADILHRRYADPVTRAQAGTCIMVELGNGKRFFFDFGSGCMRNIIAMAVPLQAVNDIFFTHLHVDLDPGQWESNRDLSKANAERWKSR